LFAIGQFYLVEHYKKDTPMARRRSYRPRGYRRSHRASKANAQALAALFALFAACIFFGFKILLRLGRWYIGKWQQADRRGRMMLAGGLAGTFVVLCGVGALSNPSPPANNATALTSQAAPAAARRATEVDPTVTAIPAPTLRPSPTAMPPTPTAMPAPPSGQVVNGGNLRSEPRVVPATVIGQMCANDDVEFVSQQTIGEDLWYRIRVKGRKADCTTKQVAPGTEGWASSTLLSRPSYAIEDYVHAVGITLPTAIVLPTAMPKPTAIAKPKAEPTAPVFSGVRVGAICRDGTRSNATGRGACSHHGGVDHWLYR
jgi:hypothetical protein